jgi:hypothetical protein
MPTAVKFQIQQVHDKADRRRVERRTGELMTIYSNALGGMHTLGAADRVDIEIAAQLTALVELGQERVGGSPEPGDPAALKRLETLATAAVSKLELNV